MCRSEHLCPLAKLRADLSFFPCCLDSSLFLTMGFRDLGRDGCCNERRSGPGEAARRPGTILFDGTRADGDTMDTPPTQIPIDLARAEPLRKKKMEQNKSRIVMLPESARTISRRKNDRGEGVSIPYQQIETDPVLESPLEWTLRWVGGGWCRRRRRRSGEEDEVVPAASEAERSGAGGFGAAGRRSGSRGDAGCEPLVLRATRRRWASRPGREAPLQLCGPIGGVTRVCGAAEPAPLASLLKRLRT